MCCRSEDFGVTWAMEALGTAEHDNGISHSCPSRLGGSSSLICQRMAVHNRQVPHFGERFSKNARIPSWASEVWAFSTMAQQATS